MPRMIDEIMINTSADSRLPCDRLMTAAGSLVPIPVNVTTPMTTPTLAAAATRGTTSRDACTQASSAFFQVMRVRGLKRLATMTPTVARLTARNTV